MNQYLPPVPAAARLPGLTVLAALLAAFAFWNPLPPTQAQADPHVWAPVDAGLPNTMTFNSVFMVNGTNGAWIAATDGPLGHAIRLRRENGRWTSAGGPGFRAPLRAIVAVTDDHIWAVGDNGLIVEGWGDKYWREVPNPIPQANLTAIQMFGNGEEGWAVGTLPPAQGGGPTPVVLHYIDGSWQTASYIIGPGTLTGLHFAGGGGWIVGGVEGIGAWRHSPAGWEAEEIPCLRVRFFCAGQPAAVRALGNDEAWAVGTLESGILSGIMILHRLHGQWNAVFPGEELVDDTFPGPRQRARLNGVSFTTATNGLAVGWQHQVWTSPDYPLILSYRPNGRWHYENIPYYQGVSLNAVSHADADHALAVGSNGVILGYGYGGPPPAPWPTPTLVPPGPPTATPRPDPLTPGPDPHLPGVLYFPETGHTLQGGFRAYWEAHGGLAQFGYPITEEFVDASPENGQLYTVQYFERNRFEWHPENRPPYDVLLGLLGRTVTAGRGGEPPFQPVPGGPPGSRYFPETGHVLAPEFAAYWEDHGGLPVYGYPISEPFTEVNQADGRSYLVQYFERNRFEYHPELPAPFRVSLGLLGTEVLRARGWLP